MKSSTRYRPSRLSTAFTAASRSVKIPTRRSSSHTSRQSVSSWCISRIASATGSDGATVRKLPMPSRVEVLAEHGVVVLQRRLRDVAAR